MLLDNFFLWPRHVLVGRRPPRRARRPCLFGSLWSRSRTFRRVRDASWSVEDVPFVFEKRSNRLRTSYLCPRLLLVGWRPPIRAGRPLLVGRASPGAFGRVRGCFVLFETHHGRSRMSVSCSRLVLVGRRPPRKACSPLLVGRVSPGASGHVWGCSVVFETRPGRFEFLHFSSKTFLSSNSFTNLSD